MVSYVMLIEDLYVKDYRTEDCTYSVLTNKNDTIPKRLCYSVCVVKK